MSKQYSNNSLLCALIALAIASGVAYLIFNSFQHTVQRVIVKGYFPNDTYVSLSTLSSSDRETHLDSFLVKGSKQRQILTAGSTFLNTTVHRLKIDFTQPQGYQPTTRSKVGITNIEVLMPYLQTHYFNGDKIGIFFKSSLNSNEPAHSFGYPNQGQTISLTSKRQIAQMSNLTLTAGVSFIFFLGSFFLLRQLSISAVPAFKDMSIGNRISSSHEFDTVNGLRGLAAILVLFSHTAPGYHSTQVGLALLFVISGFLLSKPFVLQPNKIFSLSNIERYVRKRIKRILPMYYFFVFITYILTFKFDTAIRHFVFVQAEGHLWPMTQIFLFYMILPFILIIGSVGYRLHRILPIILGVIAIFYAIEYMGSWMPFYNGDHSKEFYLYAFLMGVVTSYIQYDLVGSRGLSEWGRRWTRELAGFIAVTLLFVGIAWSGPFKPNGLLLHFSSQFWVKCVFCCIVILMALNTPKTIYHKLLGNCVFRSVGVVGFSFYLLHGLGIKIFTHGYNQLISNQLDPRSWQLTAGAFAITYLMAIFTYSYIERPFFGYREQKKTQDT